MGVGLARPPVLPVRPEGMSSLEVARLFGVGRSAVAVWCRGGFFPGAFKTPGGQWRIPHKEVDELAAALRWEGR